MTSAANEDTLPVNGIAGLARLGAAQHGAVTRAQAVALGLFRQGRRRTRRDGPATAGGARRLLLDKRGSVARTTGDGGLPRDGGRRGVRSDSYASLRLRPRQAACRGAGPGSRDLDGCPQAAQEPRRDGPSCPCDEAGRSRPAERYPGHLADPDARRRSLVAAAGDAGTVHRPPTRHQTGHTTPTRVAGQGSVRSGGARPARSFTPSGLP
jgi:hypothetical protein